MEERTRRPSPGTFKQGTSGTWSRNNKVRNNKRNIGIGGLNSNLRNSFAPTNSMAFNSTFNNNHNNFSGGRNNRFVNRVSKLSPPPQTNTGMYGGFSKTMLVVIFVAGMIGRTILKALLGDAASPVVLLLLGGFLYYYRYQQKLKQEQTVEGIRNMQNNIGSVNSEGFSTVFGGRGGNSRGSNMMNSNDRNLFGPQSGTIKLSRAEVQKHRHNTQTNMNSLSKDLSTIEGEKVNKTERRVYKGRTKRQRRHKLSSKPISGAL